MPPAFRKDQDHVYRAPALEQFPWLEHGFATRLAGNWPDPARLALLKQIHSADVVAVETGAGYLGEGDALITQGAGLLVGVRTADCVPILLADAERRTVAAVHAGWRGTARNIALRAVLELAVRYGSKPENIWAAIGPAVGDCCYEVGPDVAASFVEWWPDLAGNTEPLRLDLEETNRRQLIGAGLTIDRISSAGLCTCCGLQDFHSFRRDRETSGRMISAIGIRSV